MGAIFGQKQTATLCGPQVACYGGYMGVQTYDRRCETIGFAGAPGTAECGMPNGETEWACVFWEITPGATYSQWAAGDYVVRCNITTANSAITWEHTYICRLDLNCIALETIGSLTGQAISLATTGVKTMTVAGALIASPASTDHIYIVCVFGNTGAGSATFGVRGNQNIDTPLVAGSGPPPLSWEFRDGGLLVPSHQIVAIGY